MSIAATETHLIDTIKADLGNRIKTVTSVPSEWTDDLLKSMLLMAPFVAVAFSGGTAPKPGSSYAYMDGNWEVYVGTAHASGQQARRLGDALQIGTYELIERMVGLLHGHTVPDVGTLDFRSVDNLFTGTVERQGLAVYGIRFALPMTALPPAAVALDDFETFDAQYDLPPLADDVAHQAWLAGDYSSTRPDAHDTVVLPTAP